MSVEDADRAAAPTAEHLEVYDTRVGPWNPEYGDIEIPDDWDFLPSGDHFVTHRVTTAGTYWIAWRPRRKGRGHRRRVGLWAPAKTIAEARQAAAETEASRATSRRSGARQRARREDRYREELRAAIVAYLDFSDVHAELAATIADAAAQRAAEVGSGRVGRTSKLSLADKAELAARAHIRHRFTDYESDLENLPVEELWTDDAAYLDARQSAHAAVDAFLSVRRARG